MSERGRHGGHGRPSGVELAVPGQSSPYAVSYAYVRAFVLLVVAVSMCTISCASYHAGRTVTNRDQHSMRANPGIEIMRECQGAVKTSQ